MERQFTLMTPSGPTEPEQLSLQVRGAMHLLYLRHEPSKSKRHKQGEVVIMLF